MQLHDLITHMASLHFCSSFGGNPDQVTLIGQSAGGIAVSTLMLSPLTEGLFQNVIIMSGYANMLLAVQKPEEALQVAR